MASHKAFAAAHDLAFPLLPDTEGRIASLYGVDHSKGYAKRVTFVVGADGKIFRTFPKVSVAGHDDEVLVAVKQSMGMD